MNHAIDSIINIRTPFNMIVLIVLFGSIAKIATTIVTQIRQYASHRQELEFKRELIDRGMSPGEVAEVIQTKVTPGEPLGRTTATWCKNA